MTHTPDTTAPPVSLCPECGKTSTVGRVVETGEVLRECSYVCAGQHIWIVKWVDMQAVGA